MNEQRQEAADGRERDRSGRGCRRAVRPVKIGYRNTFPCPSVDYYSVIDVVIRNIAVTFTPNTQSITNSSPCVDQNMADLFLITWAMIGRLMMALVIVKRRSLAGDPPRILCFLASFKNETNVNFLHFRFPLSNLQPVSPTGNRKLNSGRLLERMAVSPSSIRASPIKCGEQTETQERARSHGRIKRALPGSVPLHCYYYVFVVVFEEKDLNKRCRSSPTI